MSEETIRETANYTFGDWAINSNVEQGFHLLHHRVILDNENGQKLPVVQFAIRKTEDKGLGLQLVVTHGVDLEKGIDVKLDGEAALEGIKINFSRPDGCVSEIVKLDKKLIEKLLRAEQGEVSVTDFGNKSVLGFPFSLKGFEKGIEKITELSK